MRLGTPSTAPGLSLAAAAALVLAGFALRPQHAAIGPLIPLIRADLGISHSLAGLLATIPVACFGLFALSAPEIARRLGARTAIGICVAIAGIAGIARALAGPEWLIIALTFPLGISMGLGTALLPVLVRERFGHRPATATGFYTNGLQAGTGAVAAVAVPLAFLLGGWRASLIAISIVIVLLAVLWFVLVPAIPRERGVKLPPRPKWPLRRGIVWGVAILFGLRAIIFQGVTAWLPSIYVEQGWSQSSAAFLLVVLQVVGIPVTTVSAMLADRIGSRRVYLSIAAVSMLAGLLGMLTLPAFGIVWILAVAVALGLLFPITMTLPLDIAGRPEDVAPISSMMFGVGYMIAAVSPVGLGLIRDVTGSFQGSIAALAVVAAAILVATPLFSPRRLSPSAESGASGSAG